MEGKFVKGVNSNYSNINTTGGTHDGVLSATTHSHDSASHFHKLTSDGHKHSFRLHDRRIAAHTNYVSGYQHMGGSDGGSYTVLTANGTHRHYHDSTHNHSGSPQFTGGSHANNHGKSGEETHSHGGANSTESTNKTNGTGTGAVGTDGDQHEHTFDNRPQSKAVYFIVKVDET